MHGCIGSTEPTALQRDLSTLLDPEILDLIGPCLSDALAHAEQYGDQRSLKKLLAARQAVARLQLTLAAAPIAAIRPTAAI